MRSTRAKVAGIITGMFALTAIILSCTGCARVVHDWPTGQKMVVWHPVTWDKNLDRHIAPSGVMLCPPRNFGTKMPLDIAARYGSQNQ